MKDRPLETASIAALINMQRTFDNLAVATQVHPSNSFMLDTRPVQSNTFRGSLSEYLKQHKNLAHIDDIQLTGEQVRPGVFDSSMEWSPAQFAEFMTVVNEMKIKRLDLDGCRLTPNIGRVLGLALKTNTSLEELLVTSNQLGSRGLLAIMDGLKQNQSLKIFGSRSYNVTRYYWSVEELQALSELLRVNKTLEKIALPNNQIGEAEDIRILMDVYKEIQDREPAIIGGFDLCSSVNIPEFNRENAANGSLEKCAQVRFANHYY